jgi:hypothetical protein
VKYLTEQFQKLGLKPGNPDGSYVQKVPLAGFTPESQASIFSGKEMLSLKPQTDYVAVCRRTVPEVKVENSDLVFVGYGVVAPEYGWDDYKGLDVKGKTIVMLINDPAVPDSSDPSKLDEKMFKGRAMTYYGRWTYKYEQATRQGAIGAGTLRLAASAVALPKRSSATCAAWRRRPAPRCCASLAACCGKTTPRAMPSTMTSKAWTLDHSTTTWRLHEWQLPARAGCPTR